MDLSRFKKKPVMGILRGATSDIIEPLLDAVLDAGLETLEITMNTPGALELIRKAAALGKGRLMLGAGTVLTLDEAQAAVNAGATFIVMPVVVKEVVSFCVARGYPVFPGALTPQEIYTAWKEGASMVKVFPSKSFGPEYFRELKGPFDKIELLACGGVTAANVRSYFTCGASAVSFGASIFKKDLMAGGDFKSISLAIAALLRGATEASI